MRHDIHLAHDDVRLRPLTEDDAGGLRDIVDESSWAGMSIPLPTSTTEMSEHLTALIDDPSGMAFAVEQDARFVGRTTLYGIVPGLKLEIGNTIYARSVWGTRVNPAVKLLLLGYAFTDLEVGRVALRCDHRNARSHNAIERLGATFEGTLRHFRPAADGTIADIDYFSVLRDEWPGVRDGLEHRLRVSGTHDS